MNNNGRLTKPHRCGSEVLNIEDWNSDMNSKVNPFIFDWSKIVSTYLFNIIFGINPFRRGRWNESRV